MKLNFQTQVAAMTVLELATKNGGGTVDLRDGYMYESQTGYAVGGQYPGITFPEDDLDGAFNIAAWVSKAPDLTYMGSWVHEGVVYIDAVDIIEDRDEALKLAAERNELAIFDFATMEEVAI